MLHDIECPYCKEPLYINHDDGSTYKEEEFHQQICIHCDKTFVFQTFVSFDYAASKADCLNGDYHKYEITDAFPKVFSKMKCLDCGEERDLTEKERQIYNVETKEEFLKSLNLNKKQNIMENFEKTLKELKKLVDECVKPEDFNSLSIDYSINTIYFKSVYTIRLVFTTHSLEAICIKSAKLELAIEKFKLELKELSI
jgi:hypothetical protein